jgi:hypothetical protein
MVRVTSVTIATWGLGGFYFSLLPTLVRGATGVTLPVVGGLVVSVLTLSGVISVLGLRSALPRRILSVGTVVLAAGVAATLADVRSLSRSQGIEALGPAHSQITRGTCREAGRCFRTTPTSPIEDDNKEAFQRPRQFGSPINCPAMESGSASSEWPCSVTSSATMTMRPQATCAHVTSDSPAVNAGTEPTRALDLQRIEGGKI